MPSNRTSRRRDGRKAWALWANLPSTASRWAIYERMPDGEWMLWGNTRHTRSEAIDAFEVWQGQPADRREWRRCRRRGQVKAVRVYVGVSPLFDPFIEDEEGAKDGD